MTSKRKEFSYIAANVRRRRLRKGYSQQKLAEEMQISVRSISEIENAGTDLAVSTLYRLAEALDTKPAILLREATFEKQGPGRPAPKKKEKRTR